MTQAHAQAICEEATAVFGPHVEAQALPYRRGIAGYHAHLHHRRLGRRVELAKRDEWPEVMAMWLMVTSE